MGLGNLRDVTSPNYRIFEQKRNKTYITQFGHRGLRGDIQFCCRHSLSFYFDLEGASSDPMDRCGHGQNLTMTSESDVTISGYYHGNVCVELGGF